MKQIKNVSSVRMFGIALAIVVLMTASMAGCSNPTDPGDKTTVNTSDNGDDGGTPPGTNGGDRSGDVPPENRPVKDRWSKWVDPSSTATLVYSVDDNGVCTITVGGKAESNNETDGWNAWKASPRYDYTAKAGTCYEYTFEAWTQSGDHGFWVQYYYEYEDNNEEVYLGKYVEITNTRTTYTVRGTFLPKGGIRQVEFHCADQLGTFYVKMLEIKEYQLGKLTITNFSGSPGLVQNNEVSGQGWGSDGWDSDGWGVDLSFGTLDGLRKSVVYGDGDEYEYYDTVSPVRIKGTTLTIPVWEVSHYNWNDHVPFTGNITVEVGNLYLSQYGGVWVWSASYTNIVPITFTNGNATINFGTQMALAGIAFNGDDPGIKHWGNYWYVEENGVIIIYYDNKDATSVSIPAQINGKPVTGITGYPNGVFSDCVGLKSVTIPDSVTWIGPDAFRDCASLTSVNIPDSVTYIGEHAFEGCTSLSVTLPNSVTTIWANSFTGCISVTIPSNVINMGK